MKYLFAAGVFFLNHKPKNDKFVTEYNYEVFRYGILYGANKVYISDSRPMDFMILLNYWNRIGALSGYCYVSTSKLS